MPRTITVKGIGNVSLKPDLTVITMTVKSLDKAYSKAMENESGMIGRIKDAISAVGFEKDSLKTSDFNVRTEYESVRDANGNYRNIFSGYVCTEILKLEFDFDVSRLSRVLTAISECIAEPELSVMFTVRDKNAASKALLERAAVDAREKADILASASGISIGNLLSIDYSCKNYDLSSPTNYRMEAKCMAFGNGVGMDITPENIELSDGALFVFEII